MRFFAAEGNNGVSLCGQANTACIFAGIREKQVKIRSGMPLRILMWGVFGVILKRSIKDTFSLIVLLYDQKYQKSFKRAFLPLKKHLPRARVSRASHAWQVRAANGRVKVGGFTALRGFSYTTRANITHEKAEQIRARIVCTPAEKEWRGRGWSLCVAGKLRYSFYFVCWIYLSFIL